MKLKSKKTIKELIIFGIARYGDTVFLWLHSVISSMNSGSFVEISVWLVFLATLYFFE